MKLSIIIPAYNEEKRIEHTLRTYHQFFVRRSAISTKFVIAINGCRDNTLGVVQRLQQELGDHICILDLPHAGKGYAIIEGFKSALQCDNDLIGFVDADMATRPEYFFDLVTNIGNNDGIIASRYMPGSQVYPPRPWIKRWGSRLIYESLVRLLFGLSYYDFQCGAKLFTRASLVSIVPGLTVRQWAFDVELLYLYKKAGYAIAEIPTTWYDQEDSKLTLRSGFRMLGTLFVLRMRHSFLKRFFMQIH